MRIVIDTGILVKAFGKRAETEYVSVVHQLLLNRFVRHQLCLDRENLIQTAYDKKVGNEKSYRKWYKRARELRRIHSVSSHQIGQEHIQFLAEHGCKKVSNHVFIGTAFNEDKILISEDPELDKDREVLPYLRRRMNIRILDAAGALSERSLMIPNSGLRKPMSKIFISYSHKDGEEIAEFLHERLSGCGYDVWKDNHDLPLGINFPRAISDALQMSTEFIVLLTKASLQSDWVGHEIDMAMTAGCRVLPIVAGEISNDEIPLYLRKIHYLLMEGEDDWRALDRLVKSLDGGDKIPRVYNLSGHSIIQVHGALLLGQSRFEKANLAMPASVVKIARNLAEEALPYIKAGAGIVPPGHPAVTAAVLAFLVGTNNAMPRLFPTHQTDGKFGIRGDRYIKLQDIREQGFSYRGGS